MSMKKRDKQLSRALKGAFPRQYTKEKHLHNRILEQLPEREYYNPDKILTLLNFAAIAVCVATLLMFDWNEIIKNITHVTNCYLKNEYYEINSYVLLLPFIFITIIWLIKNTIEEYREKKNFDILERAIKQRQRREVAP